MACLTISLQRKLQYDNGIFHSLDSNEHAWFQIVLIIPKLQY